MISSLSLFLNSNFTWLSLAYQVTELEEKNSRLEAELRQAKGEVVQANLSSVNLGKTIVRLRQPSAFWQLKIFLNIFFKWQNISLFIQTAAKYQLYSKSYRIFTILPW